MKIRVVNDLLTYLDDDISWRRKEIIELLALATKAKGKNADVHVRAGVALLYAHWEGFIKNAANAYVSYLSFRGDKTRDLQDCFIALSVKTKLSEMGQSGKSCVAIPVVANLLLDLDRRATLPKAGITAESNLSSDVFQNIAGWLGIETTQYSTRFTLIDESLLASRNKIAHGEFLSINPLRFTTLADEILEMMTWFKTDIENAVAQSAFLRRA